MYVKELPWYFSQVMEDKTVFLPLLPAGLPDHAVEERQLCRTHGLRSVVAVPLRIGMGVIGLIAFQFVKQPCNWRPDVVSRLRLIGEVFANALVRKYSEQALRKSESRFRTLFEDAPVAIGIGRDGLQLHANRAYLKLFGYQRTEEVLDRPIADFWAPEWRALIDHARPSTLARFARCLGVRSRGSAQERFTVPSERSGDGRGASRRQGHTGRSSPTSPSGREAEEKLQDMRQQLTHVARLSTLGEMAAELAHELNHPLYAILNYAKATRNVLAEEGPPDLDSVREWNEEIAGTAVSAAEVVKRLRAVRAARRSPHTACRIEQIVEEAVGLVAVELRHARVRVQTSFPTALPPVTVDRVQIQQVLVNLLTNAIDAVKALPADRRTVAVSASPGDGGLEVVVSDRGHGLPPGMRGRRSSSPSSPPSRRAWAWG